MFSGTAPTKTAGKENAECRRMAAKNCGPGRHGQFTIFPVSRLHFLLLQKALRGYVVGGFG